MVSRRDFSDRRGGSPLREDSWSSPDSLSYSYSSSRSRSASYSSLTSSRSSSSSREYRRHDRRRVRSRSLSPALSRRRTRGDSVLGEAPPCTSVLPVAPVRGASEAISSLPPVLDGPVLPSPPEMMAGSVLGAPDSPGEDWPCGVCSNINSKQRVSCFRCGCSYSESLLAMPSYEICLTKTPPGCRPAKVEAAVRRMAPHSALQYVGMDSTKGEVYLQFSTVGDATKYLVQSHCELLLKENDREDEPAVPMRLSFSLNPHPLHDEGETQAEAARAAVLAATVEREAALQAAEVPRLLWPHMWHEPPEFATLDERRTYLSTMSTYWEHLSEAQRRYYDAEVKKALLRTVIPPSVVLEDTIKASVSPLSIVDGAAANGSPSADVSADGSRGLSGANSSSSSLPSADGAATKGVGKTSNALDGLKRRLAERKSALKKTDGADCAKVSAIAAATIGSAPSSATSTAAMRSGRNAAAAAPPSLRGTGHGDFPQSPSTVSAALLTWNGFPVPLQYATLKEVPRSIELARVPMSVCERLLPPALLEVARMQFKPSLKVLSKRNDS